MHPAVVSRLVEEIAPRIAGAKVVGAHAAGAGCLIVELALDAEPSSGAGSSSDGGRFLGVVTLKAMPLIFLAGRDQRVPGGRREPQQGIEREFAGATIVGLATEGDAVATLAFRRTLVTGRTVDRVLWIDLGRRPRLAVRDAAAARDQTGGAAGGAKAPVAAIGDGRPTVAWRHDHAGRIHVRVSASTAEGDAEASRSFESVNGAAAFAFGEFWAPLELERRQSVIRRRIATALRRKRRAAGRVRADLEAPGQAEEYRRKARLLLTRQKEIRRAPRVEIMDYDGTTRVEIEIDPALTPAQNAEVLFRRARKADRKAQAAPARLAELEQEEARLRELAADLDRASEDEILALESEFGVRETRGGGAKQPGLRARYRTYTVAGGWEVLVGKSNRDNDVLTHRIARPSDLWFHVRQAAGSHVILRRQGKKAEPDRQAIIEAAAIAAFHSKAGRSSKVPVCYTEKRHVRKPRGARPGLAVVKREKVVFVEPRLPAT